MTKFTERETEVCNMVLKGFKNHEIAKALYVSRRTVEEDLRSIFQKKGVTNRTQLAGVILSEVYEQLDKIKSCYGIS